jgi:hypothetical protein
LIFISASAAGGFSPCLLWTKMSQERFAVKFFFESTTYRMFLIQDIVDGLEAAPMVWGYSKI